jgi:predicted TIM-barrel fold metal-dependent hydrolase
VRKVDVHTHIQPDAWAEAVKLMNRYGIDHIVNLSGGPPGNLSRNPGPGPLEQQLQLAQAAAPGRVTTFCNLRWGLAQKVPYEQLVPHLMLEVDACKKLGAKGVKISKGLGLGYVDQKGKLIPVDEPALDPVFERIGQQGLVVAIHTGDPKAFWQPVSPRNERYDELKVHPGWSFAGPEYPSWEALYKQFENRVARHPKTRFIGVHFGNVPEDPERVSKMLSKYPNLYVDTAARVPEIGRYPAAKLRAVFVKHQDRILFGTDTGVAPDGDLMLGSSGEEKPTLADADHFYTSTWKFFETAARAMKHPTPIQGRWTIDAIQLPRTVLEKFYGGNADRLFQLK